MNDGKLDRRVRYTKAMLKNALVQLMQQQHISGISVKSLCEIADINRSTFYMHYTDQYDLLHRMEEEVMANLRLHLEKQDYKDNLPLSSQVLINILNYAKENADMFMVLLGENCDFTFQKDIFELAQIVSNQYYLSLDQRTKEYLELFGITGCVSMFHKWLKDGTVESAEKITDLFLQVLYYGMTSIK